MGLTTPGPQTAVAITVLLLLYPPGQDKEPTHGFRGALMLGGENQHLLTSSAGLSSVKSQSFLRAWGAFKLGIVSFILLRGIRKFAANIPAKGNSCLPTAELLGAHAPSL